MFTKNERIDEMEQLFYCKLYPSLEKETEKLFGMKMFDCKTLLNDNAKLNDSCENESYLLNGNYVCEDGTYQKAYEIYETKYFDVLRYVEFDNMESDVDYLCPAGQTSECVKYGPLYTREVALKACKNEWSLPSEVEMELFLGESRDDFMIQNIDGNFALYWSYEGTNDQPYMGVKWADGQTNVFSNTRFNASKGISSKNGLPVASVVCLKTKQCDNEFVGKFVCENSRWRKASDYERKTQKLCRDENRGEFIDDLVCDYEWRRPTYIEEQIQELCFDRNYGNVRNLQKNNMVVHEPTIKRPTKPSRYGNKNVLYYCDKASKEWIEKPSRAIYGYIQDARDGKEYRTVIVGKQEWMSDYLDYDVVGAGEVHGQRLYSWNMTQNACPAGYRMPTKQDWKTLVDFINEAFGKSEKIAPPKKTESTVGYLECVSCKAYQDDYTELLKFDAKDYRQFGFVGGGAWLSKEKSRNQAYLTSVDNDGLRVSFDFKEKMFPIRCIKK